MTLQNFEEYQKNLSINREEAKELFKSLSNGQDSISFWQFMHYYKPGLDKELLMRTFKSYAKM